MLADGAVISSMHYRYPLCVLVEVVAHQSAELLEASITIAMSEGIIADACLAQSLSQTAALWDIRDNVDALAVALHPSLIYDVGLPTSRMDVYVDTLRTAVRERWVASRMAIFCYIADDNLHLGVHTGNEVDHGAVDQLVYGLLGPLNGSVSAEHGISLDRRAYLRLSKNPEEIRLMKQLRYRLDPRDTLNPGKIFC